AALAKLPEGTSSAEGFLDSDGVVVDKPIKLAVTVAVKDGLAHFDFSNSDPQAKGPVNLRPSMVEACVFYALIGSLGPNLHFNDGMRDVVRLTFAPRTIVNAEPPAPVSSYQMVNLLLVDVILEALAQFNPARAVAHSGASSALGISWSKGRPGQSTMQYEIAGSAYGGGLGHDGTTATATHLSNLHTTPIEILVGGRICMSFTSWRGVVGMVNPTMRPGMTEEVCRLLPEGIGLIPLFLNIRRGTEDEFETMMPHYEKLIAVLAEQNCDLIH